MAVRVQLSRFGEILDTIRAERGDRLKDIAARYGHHETTVADARRFPMPHKPQINVLESLADYTGMAIAAISAAMQDAPGPSAAATYPLVTHVGIQYRPALLVDRGCDHCEYLDQCRHTVIDLDGFALCEDVIPVDLLAPQAAATLIRNYQEDRRARNQVRAMA